MKKLITLFTPLLFVIAPIQAEENYQHFPAIAAPGTHVALCNLRAFNEKLNAILSKEDLTPEDMVKVHELTYTLENAVMRLQKDLETVAADLEEVHLASERLDSETIKNRGDAYLSATGLILDPKGCE
ncbi:DUF6746 family protein [Thalassotalea sp. PS06]|uniref:DUF6746 family protein n=1 Tax=Thalassotalea sp. PS06 TaxID=2594005 RepID=UPI0011629D1E|nr:DUF6746 family protein [Thalassotalea sp. PS06]QDP02802.1 hypothetical protein FNC98_16505 [Thalassotalea sp. PS06]